MTSSRSGRVELERPLEQARRGPVVAAPERAATGGGEPLGGALGQSRRPAVRARAGSGLPARGGSRGSRPARPARRRAARASRRSARAARLAWLSGARRRRRRGSAGGGSGSRPRRANCAGRDGSARRRTSAARRGVTWVSSGAERLHGAAVEDLALDRAALEHPPLGRVELVEAGREQRLQASAAPRPRSPPSPAIASISPMKSGLPPAAVAILSRSSSGTAAPIKLPRPRR